MPSKQAPTATSTIVPFKPLPRASLPAVQLALPPSVGTQTAPAQEAVDLSGRTKVWFVSGRGKTGKTQLTRWLIEKIQETGGRAIIAACDPVNRSLRRYVPEVAEPPGTDAADVRAWLMALLEVSMSARTDAVVDLGGGDTSLTSLLVDWPGLAGFLEDAGVEPVAVYLVGSDPDDLTPLSIAEGLGFCPRATAIVLNEVSGRREQFAQIMEHPVYLAAVERGAVSLWMPAMWQESVAWANSQECGFGEAAGRAGPFVRMGIQRWLGRMDQEFAPVRTWVPA